MTCECVHFEDDPSKYEHLVAKGSECALKALKTVSEISILANKSKFVVSTLFSVFLLIGVGNSFLVCRTSAQGQPAAPDAVIAEMVSKITDSEIYDAAFSLQNFTTRRYGYSGNAEVASYLYDRLVNTSGLAVEYQGSYKNVIATLAGNDMTSNAVYIVGAHYDSTSSNQTYAPGVTDNAGGVGIVLEFARIMSQYKFNHTLKFALWNAEENGVLGSSDYVRYAQDNNLNISLYLNFDSSSYDPDGRLVLDIISNDVSKWVSDMMTEYNSLYSINLTLAHNVHTCASDHKPFWQYGYPAVMTHAESHGPAHSQYDTIDKISTIYAKKNGQLGMSVLARLAAGPYAVPMIGEFQRAPDYPLFLLALMLVMGTLLAVIFSRARSRGES